MSTSVRFVRRLIAQRRIEFVKVGRHVRISESALAEFIERGPRPADDPSRYVAQDEGSCLMANKDGHRRFGNVRRLPSGRFQIRYPGPDGRIRTGPDTYDRKSDADKALVLIEAQIAAGEWTDPDRGKVKLADYAATWITERPKLRPRTVDLYRWLLKKHIAPYLGGVPIGKLSTAMIREWRAKLLGNGVSVSVAAKAYRLLRAVLMTAVEEDKILARNPCRIRGAGDEDAPERPVLTVAQVFALAELVGRRPVGNIRKLPAGGYRLRFRRHGEIRTSPEVYGTRAEAEQALWKMADDGRADCHHDRRYLALVLLATFASLRWGEVTALRRCDIDLDGGHRAGPGGAGGAVNGRDPARPAQVPGRAARGRHPPGDHPGTPRAPVDLREGRAGRAGLPRRPGRPAAAGQLQQDVGLAVRRAVDRCRRAALP